MKIIFIERNTLFRTQELIDHNSKQKIGKMPCWKITTTVINILLFSIIYIILKITSLDITPEIVAILLLIEGNLRCLILYIVATVYANTAQGLLRVDNQGRKTDN